MHTVMSCILEPEMCGSGFPVSFDPLQKYSPTIVERSTQYHWGQMSAAVQPTEINTLGNYLLGGFPYGVLQLKMCWQCERVAHLYGPLWGKPEVIIQDGKFSGEMEYFEFRFVNVKWTGFLMNNILSGEGGGLHWKAIWSAGDFCLGVVRNLPMVTPPLDPSE